MAKRTVYSRSLSSHERTFASAASGSTASPRQDSWSQGQEALHLRNQPTEVALLHDDERVQLRLLENAMGQHRQKLVHVGAPGEPLRELPQIGRAHAYDRTRVDIRYELRLKRAVALIGMGGEKRLDILMN